MKQLVEDKELVFGILEDTVPKVCAPFEEFMKVDVDLSYGSSSSSDDEEDETGQ